MSHSRITIRDVAAKAGVSHQTVSRVINGSQQVRPDTRQRVQRAIVALGYRPNAIARSMAKGRTGTLACLTPNLTDYTFASIIEGAQQEARAHGFFLMSAAAPDEETFGAFVEQLVGSRRTEGLIVVNPYQDGRFSLLPPDIPVVFAGARPREEDATSSVALDDVAVARQATEHLLQMGHRQLAMICGRPNEDCTQDRTTGFAAALQAAGLHLDAMPVETGDWTAVSGYEAMIRLFGQETLPTAVFAQNDQMAVGVLKAAAELGLNVPQDLSVISIDDIPLAAYFSPALTTFRQEFSDIGKTAVSLLVQAIETPDDQGQHLLIPAKFIERRSVCSLSLPSKIQHQRDK